MVRDLPRVMTHSSPCWNRGIPSLAGLKIFIFVQLRPSFPGFPFFEKKVVIFILDLFSIEVFLPPLFQVFPVEV